MHSMMMFCSVIVKLVDSLLLSLYVDVDDDDVDDDEFVEE